jgi:hypothetical protein
LTVNNAGISVTIVPPAATKNMGENVSFKATVTGITAVSYKWQRNGSDLADGGAASGATSAELKLTGVKASDAGKYKVMAADSTGAASATAEAALTVNNAGPSVTIVPPAATKNVGENVSFKATVTGITAPSYKWQRNGSDLADGGAVSGATSAELKLTGVKASDAGKYKVMAADSTGTASATTEATLTVH